MATTTLAHQEPSPSPWLTVREAAARAKCGVKVIYGAITGHRLKAVKVGQALRIHVGWLDAWLTTEATVINPEAPGEAMPFRRRQG